MSRPEEPQVSWKVIESGAAIVSAEGDEAATVSRVVGDADADVFTGLAVKTGLLGGERLLPSERVTAIWPERIEVSLSKAEIDGLPAYEDAPTVRVDPGGGSSFFRRLLGR